MKLLERLLMSLMTKVTEAAEGSRCFYYKNTLVRVCIRFSHSLTATCVITRAQAGFDSYGSEMFSNYLSLLFLNETDCRARGIPVLIIVAVELTLQRYARRKNISLVPQSVQEFR